MAIRTSSPIWLSTVLFIGLALVFLGERPLATFELAHTLCTGIGLAAIAVSTILRLVARQRAGAAQRPVETIFLWCHAGICLALVGYFLTTQTGLGWIGLADWEDKRLDRFIIPTTVLWVTVLLCSLVPLVLAEFSLGAALRTRWPSAEEFTNTDSQTSVEYVRVKQIATSGLSIALCSAFLMTTCQIANEKNIRKDVSYFKTASPGESTLKIVQHSSEPIRALLFYPQVNEVKAELLGYFQEVARKTSTSNTAKLVIEQLDQRIHPAIAKEHGVSKNGTIVLIRNDKKQKFSISEKTKKARPQLRKLDATINSELKKVVREKRVAYMTVGHGEINDPGSVGPLGRPMPRGQSRITKEILRKLNYEVKDLGSMQGLGADIPADATIVLALGPMANFSVAEIESLTQYVQAGGALFVALDPKSEMEMQSLGDVLGIRFHKTPVTDDKYYYVRSGSPFARRIIRTNQFSPHPATTAMNRAKANYGIQLVESGHFTEKVPVPDVFKRTFIVRSMDSSWLDVQDDFQFNKDKEKRGKYNLGVAIENKKPATKSNSEDPTKENTVSPRVIVYADRDIFSDAVIGDAVPLQTIFADAINWLGGEEDFSGEIVSEKDIRIEHTRKEDVLWFWSSIAGVPLAVLGLGLWFVSRRRRSLRHKGAKKLAKRKQS